MLAVLLKSLDGGGGGLRCKIGLIFHKKRLSIIIIYDDFLEEEECYS